MTNGSESFRTTNSPPSSTPPTSYPPSSDTPHSSTTASPTGQRHQKPLRSSSFADPDGGSNSIAGGVGASPGHSNIPNPSSSSLTSSNNLAKERSVSGPASTLSDSLAALGHISTSSSSSSGATPTPAPAISSSGQKKWKQILKFGSIGRKSSASSGMPMEQFHHRQLSDHSHLQILPSALASSTLAPRLPQIPNSAGPSLGASFQPMMGSTVVEDPNSLDSHSLGSNDGFSTGTAAGLAPPAIIDTNGHGCGKAKSQQVRRVSSAPDTKKAVSANGVGGSKDSATGKLRGPYFHQNSTPSRTVANHAASSLAREDGFFPGSPVRMDSTATSFSSKDFEKSSKLSKGGLSKSKSGFIFPGSRNRNGNGNSSKSSKADFRAGNQLAAPSIVDVGTGSGGSAPSTPGVFVSSEASNGAMSPGKTLREQSSRGSFRRTYSSNSIKVRDVEVGPGSFSKVKMLGKGDVGKVYLVREKKTEKLFAMKGEFALIS